MRAKQTAADCYGIPEEKMRLLLARCGYDEVNALKWNNAAYKVKKVYESVIK